jgi:outer membrane immunogenic protein
MKQFKLAASLFFTASLISSATLAHVSFKDEALAVATHAPYNWTGFYAGLNAGIVKHTLNVTDNQGASFNSTIHEVTNPQFTGGFQFGYRKQVELSKLSGVFGAEFSADFANAIFTQTYGSPFGLYQLKATNTLKSVCLMQLMGGIAADKTLLFMSGGLSWMNIAGNFTSENGAPFFNTFNVGKQALGTTLGGGAEYAFNDRISMRFKVDVITPNVYSSSDNASNTYTMSNNIVQATLGINYKFG